MNKAVLLIIPISLMSFDALSADYSIEQGKTKKGYFIRVKNHSNDALLCYLKEGRRGEYVVVRAKRTSEAYYFDKIPRLICKKR